MKKLIIISVFILSSCASMFSGTKEEITIRSEESDAQIFVNDEYVGKGIVTVTIPKKDLQKTKLTAKKTGCQESTRKIRTKFNPVTFLGCFLDMCIFTVGVVDWAATGAITEAAETTYNVTPICN